jgi:hypothetical protein
MSPLALIRATAASSDCSAISECWLIVSTTASLRIDAAEPDDDLVGG